MIPAVAPLIMAASLLWQAVRPGVWQAEAAMAAHGPLSSVRAVVLRLDPAQVRFELRSSTRDMGTRAAWAVDSLPSAALAGCNAGQFAGPEVWGWLVRGGCEIQAPGSGRLAMAFIVDEAGHCSLVSANELSHTRGHVALAFQSYPALLVGSATLPWELRARGRGADLGHRDSRLAIGTLADGEVVIVLTRFTALGHAGEQLPWGPTVGEMASWMRALGCRRAMLLDGGMSSQLAVRRADGGLERWPNWRLVPLGLVVLPGGSAPLAELAGARQR